MGRSRYDLFTHPEFYKLLELETVIVVTTKSQGRTKVEAGGRRIQAINTVDTEQYYAHIWQQWAY